ncbi:hypothetical protein PR048_024093 [Dryococelus australis]|uniref:Integrase catalytic domain-containing protein n=1 Tax=Dryococelus australis TaxID=614101 RepID=A0ABQ9GVX7_9NEOP|nr:hypothetical protein PR048_024093 [Dryococelus australis]
MVRGYRSAFNSSKHTIQVLWSLFAHFCLCTHLVSDNGPPGLLWKNGVQSILIPTYHPQSNGQAENYVKVYKHKLRMAVRKGITTLLSDIRNSVHCTTGEIPARLMFGRPLRTIYDLLRSNLSKRVEENQHKQKAHFKGQAEGQEVVIWNYNNENKWVKGVIIKKLSNVVYLVETGMDRVVKIHADQMLPSMHHIQDFRDVNEVGKVLRVISRVSSVNDAALHKPRD